jgi:hypothetical protein
MANMFILHILQEIRRKEVNPNWMPKTLMPFYEQQILMGGEKLGDKSQDDQAEHLPSYTTSFKEAN